MYQLIKLSDQDSEKRFQFVNDITFGRLFDYFKNFFLSIPRQTIGTMLLKIKPIVYSNYFDNTLYRYVSFALSMTTYTLK